VTIRVLVADDQPLMRAAFEMTLRTEDDIDLVGEAADGLEAVEQARRLLPDVILMDVRMPGWMASRRRGSWPPRIERPRS